MACSGGGYVTIVGRKRLCHRRGYVTTMSHSFNTHSTSNLGTGRMSPLKGGRWHERTDFDCEDNVWSAFGELREGKDYTDVTLACEDGQQVEAHKVVLTSSSPFFWGKHWCSSGLWRVFSEHRLREHTWTINEKIQEVDAALALGWNLRAHVNHRLDDIHNVTLV